MDNFYFRQFREANELVFSQEYERKKARKKKASVKSKKKLERQPSAIRAKKSYLSNHSSMLSGAELPSESDYLPSHRGFQLLDDAELKEEEYAMDMIVKLKEQNDSLKKEIYQLKKKLNSLQLYDNEKFQYEKSYINKFSDDYEKILIGLKHREKASNVVQLQKTSLDQETYLQNLKRSCSSNYLAELKLEIAHSKKQYHNLFEHLQTTEKEIDTIYRKIEEYKISHTYNNVQTQKFDYKYLKDALKSEMRKYNKMKQEIELLENFKIRFKNQNQATIENDSEVIKLKRILSQKRNALRIAKETYLEQTQSNINEVENAKLQQLRSVVRSQRSTSYKIKEPVLYTIYVYPINSNVTKNQILAEFTSCLPKTVVIEGGYAKITFTNKNSANKAVVLKDKGVIGKCKVNVTWEKPSHLENNDVGLEHRSASRNGSDKVKEQKSFVDRKLNESESNVSAISNKVKKGGKGSQTKSEIIQEETDNIIQTSSTLSETYESSSKKYDTGSKVVSSKSGKNGKGLVSKKSEVHNDFTETKQSKPTETVSTEEIVIGDDSDDLEDENDKHSKDSVSKDIADKSKNVKDEFSSDDGDIIIESSSDNNIEDIINSTSSEKAQKDGKDEQISSSVSLKSMTQNVVQSDTKESSYISKEKTQLESIKESEKKDDKTNDSFDSDSNDKMDVFDKQSDVDVALDSDKGTNKDEKLQKEYTDRASDNFDSDLVFDDDSDANKDEKLQKEKTNDVDDKFDSDLVFDDDSDANKDEEPQKEKTNKVDEKIDSDLVLDNESDANIDQNSSKIETKMSKVKQDSDHKVEESSSINKTKRDKENENIFSSSSSLMENDKKSHNESGRNSIKSLDLDKIDDTKGNDNPAEIVIDRDSSSNIDVFNDSSSGDNILKKTSSSDEKNNSSLKDELKEIAGSVPHSESPDKNNKDMNLTILSSHNDTKSVISYASSNEKTKETMDKASETSNEAKSKKDVHVSWDLDNIDHAKSAELSDNDF